MRMKSVLLVWLLRATPVLVTGADSNKERAGASLYFDGVDDYATVFPGFQLLSDWTIEAWVMPVPGPPLAGQCLLGMQGVALQNKLTVFTTEGNALQVSYGPDEQTIPFSAWSGAGGQDDGFSFAPHHFSLTHKVINEVQCRMELYLNGTRQAQWVVNPTAVRARPEPPLPSLLGACHVGRRDPAEGGGRGTFRTRFFRGHMDEVRWWDRVLDQDLIAASRLWSGPPLRWPQVRFASDAGEVAVLSRAAALRAQYSFDVLSSRVVDGSSNNRHGWLGTLGDARDSPQYVSSPFNNIIQYGSVYGHFRERATQVLDIAPYVFYIGSPKFCGLRLVRNLTRPDVGTTLRRLASSGGRALTAGDLISGMLIEVRTVDTVPYDNFAVQPCLGELGSVPRAEACDGQDIYDVGFLVTRSTPPMGGSNFAVQLSREGGFLTLPRLSDNITVEFKAQMTPPIIAGSTLLSLRAQSASGKSAGLEVLRLSLDPRSGAMFAACSGGNTSTWPVPGVATTTAQHLAISFERADLDKPGLSYRVMVHVDCRVVLNVTVGNLCMAIDSQQLLPATVGAQFVPDNPGALGADEPWTADFAAMYVAEVRLWDHARSTSSLCASMATRLRGNETGLRAYAPVAALDAAAAVPATRVVALASGRTVTTAASPLLAALEAVQVRCSVDLAQRMDFARGVGFAIRPSPFVLPPEVTVWETAWDQELLFSLAGHDADNYVYHRLASAGLDALRFELLTIPDLKCGHLYHQADPLWLPDERLRRQYGLPLTTILQPSDLPLRWVPFEGTTVAEMEEMGFSCSSELRYQAVDSQGLPSTHVATVRLQVWASGLRLQAVSAADPRSLGRGLSAGGLLRFQFSGPAETRITDPRVLLEVVNGSWGAGELQGFWIDSKDAFLVQLGQGADVQGAQLEPGLARFRVRRTAMLQSAGAPLSAPCMDLSSPLLGDFSKPSCPPGWTFNFSSGNCSVCPEGTFWTVLSPWPGATCAACPPGQQNSQLGALECKLCELGRYSPATVGNRSACLFAEPGTFVEQMGAAVSQPCLMGTVAESPGQPRCSACPQYADCDVPGFFGSAALARPGYFRAADGSFVPCRVPDACVRANICREGTQDPLAGCYACAPGWTRGSGSLQDSSSCRRCPSTSHFITSTVLVALGSAVLAIYLASLNVTAARRTSCLHPFVLKIGLGHLVLMQTFTVLEEWELRPGFAEAAPVVRGVLAYVFAWDGMMPVELVNMDCILESFGGRATRRLWVALATWLILPAAFAVFCFVLSVLIVLIYRFIAPLLGLCASSVADATDDGTSVEDTPGAQMSGVMPSWIPPGGDAPRSHLDPTLVPIGWQVVWSEEHQRYYYHHVASAVSTWNQPALIVQPQHHKVPEKQDTFKTNTDEELQAEAQERLLGIWRLPPLHLGEPLSWRLVIVSFLEDSCGILLTSLLLTYPPVLRQLMAFVRCAPLAGRDSTSRLLAAPEVICGSEDHFALAATAGVALLVWGLGLPMVIAITTWGYRRRLAHFDVRVKIGVLAAEYEPKYFYWDSLVLLRRFAAIIAAWLAPAGPRALQLVQLLAIGNAFAFMHHGNEPFDNRSGILLDTLESQGLKVFCAAAAILLLGVSEVMNPYFCAGAFLAVTVAHVLYLSWLIWTFLVHLRRAVAEEVLECKMQRKAGPSWRCLRHLRHRIFKWEVAAQQRCAQATFNEEEGVIELVPGPAGIEVRDYERRFLACGISGCFAHAISECKVERLSVHFMEFLARLAFASAKSRLASMDKLYKRSDSRWSVKSTLSNLPDYEVSRTTAAMINNFFDPQTFRLAMSASDMQASLTSIALYSKEHLEQAFHDFMIRKGVTHCDYHLSPRERMLAKCLPFRRQPKTVDAAPKRDGSAPETAGAEAASHVVAVVEGGHVDLVASKMGSEVVDWEGSERITPDASPALSRSTSYGPGHGTVHGHRPAHNGAHNDRLALPASFSQGDFERAVSDPSPAVSEYGGLSRAMSKDVFPSTESRDSIFDIDHRLSNISAAVSEFGGRLSAMLNTGQRQSTGHEFPGSLGSVQERDDADPSPDLSELEGMLCDPSPGTSAEKQHASSRNSSALPQDSAHIHLPGAVH